MAKRLHIALITERFGKKFGGAEAYAEQLFQQLATRHEITVIAREFAHELPVVNEVLVKKCQGWPSWMRALHFAYWSNRLSKNLTKCDVIHTHAMGPAGDVHVVHVVPVKYRRFNMQSRWRGIFSCLQLRTIAYLWLESASLRLKLGRRVVAVSPSVQAQLGVAYPAQKHVEMIPPGVCFVPVTLQARAQIRHQVRARLGWSHNDVGCLLVARNPLRKGFAVILQALLACPVEYKLAVVGADAQARVFLDRKYPELSARVSLLDPLSDVSPYYQSADIYVHPTLRDSFGMAPLEAMAHGCPVVLSAAQYCGFAAFVQHQHDAWVLNDPHNSSELVTALLALHPTHILGAQLRRESTHLVQAFSWEAVSNRYEMLYQSIVKERSIAQIQPRTQ